MDQKLPNKNVGKAKICIGCLKSKQCESAIEVHLCEDVDFKDKPTLVWVGQLRSELFCPENEV